MPTREVSFRDFSGGLNTRDQASALAENEFLESLNTTIDEKGKPQKRLGYDRRYVTANSSDLVANVFYWSSQNKLISQQGTGMYDGSATSPFHTWSTSARVGMAEMGVYLMMAHPVDGVKLWNNAVISTPTNAPKGSTIIAWQNRPWVGGDPAQPPRLYYGNLGDPTVYGGTDFNDIKEKDSRIITCLAGASGQDDVGRPGMLVFKEDSAYRVTNEDTGDYVTIDANVGCGSNIGAVSLYGRTYVCSSRGIYFTDGINAMAEVSDKINPFFDKTSINRTRPDLFAAGRYNDRVFFSYPLVGQTANGRALEHHPGAQWVVPHSNAASCYATIGRGDSEMVFGSPSVVGRIYNSHTGGDDDGSAITSYLRTHWLKPASGFQAMVQRLRVVGLGTFTLAPYVNFELGTSIPSLDIDISPSGITWDGGARWDDGSVWGPLSLQEQQDAWIRQACHAISLRIDETSSGTTTSSDGREQGAWTLDEIKLLVTDLGLV